MLLGTKHSLKDAPSPQEEDLLNISHVYNWKLTEVTGEYYLKSFALLAELKQQ